MDFGVAIFPTEDVPDPAELALALEAAVQGNMFLSPRVTGGLMPRGTMRAQAGSAARSRSKWRCCETTAKGASTSFSPRARSSS